MSTISSLWKKLKSRAYRRAYVASYMKRSIPFQITEMRKARGWSQARLAKASGLTQGVISRAEDPTYGDMTLKTLLRIGVGFDVAFVAEFVPFSELAKRAEILSEESVRIASFAQDAEPQFSSDTTGYLESLRQCAAAVIGVGSTWKEFDKQVLEKLGEISGQVLTYRIQPGAPTQTLCTLTPANISRGTSQILRDAPPSVSYPAANSLALGSFKNELVMAHA